MMECKILNFSLLRHLIIAGSLWLLSMFTSVVQASSLVLTVYIGAFFVPLLYTKYRQSIDPVMKQAFTQAKEKIESMHRYAKAGGVTAAILLLGYRTSYVNIAIAVFIFCVYARSQHPDDVSHRPCRMECF